MTAQAMSQDIKEVELLSVPSCYGEGANDGAYYPIGLLSIGTHLTSAMPNLNVSIIDLHHEADFEPSAEIVGLSASSTLNYRNVLRLAERAKARGATVVVGGAHATQLTEQVLRNRRGLIDFVVRGYGERAFVSLLMAMQTGSDLQNVPNLSWHTGHEVIHTTSTMNRWEYDNFNDPLDFSLLRCGLRPYWDAFKRRIDPNVDAAFVVFTHFGCGYREKMRAQRNNRSSRPSSWCIYCSLNDPLLSRSGEAIVAEVSDLLRSTSINSGANILLKCYGDNVGTQLAMLRDLALAIEKNAVWGNYCIGWTFYAQSSRVTVQLVKLLARVGTKHLFIGFDTVNNSVQRLNGLGTSCITHRRAVRLCMDYGIRIQAGFVLGCAGETQRSLGETLRFAEELASQGVLERINSAVLFIIPGSPAYSLLAEREPWIRELDILPTEELQWQWVRHFCPHLGKNPSDGLAILQRAASRLDDLSPGPHASMGYISSRLEDDCLRESARL